MDFNRPWGTECPDRLRHIWTWRQRGLQKRLCWVPWSIHHGWWSQKNIWPFWFNPDQSSVWKCKAKLDTESREHGLGSVHETLPQCTRDSKLLLKQVCYNDEVFVVSNVTRKFFYIFFPWKVELIQLLGNNLSVLWLDMIVSFSFFQDREADCL